MTDAITFATRLRRLAALAPAALLAACASSTPQWDARFGESVRGALAAQAINPGAARNQNPVAGLDGKAARAALERYEHSFTTPPAPPPPMSIGGAK